MPYYLVQMKREWLVSKSILLMVIVMAIMLGSRKVLSERVNYHIIYYSQFEVKIHIKNSLI